MIEINLHGVQMELMVDVEGVRHLALTDPSSGIVIRLGLPEEAAKTLAGGLTGSPLVVAGADDLSRLAKKGM